MITSKAIPVQRGCGTRTEGGIYAEVGMGGPGGRPIEDFLLCPPIRIDPTALRLTPRGVVLFEKEGVHHILDWVGSQHYPNVADFVEEARRFGVSRKLSPLLDFAKLTPESRLFLVHPRAWVENYDEYYKQWVKGAYLGYSDGSWRPPGRCPKAIAEHDLPDPPLTCCAGIHWQDVEQGVPFPNKVNNPRIVSRIMPAFNYVGVAKAAGIKPHYAPAIFMSLSLTRLVVIEARNGEHVKRQAKAAQSGLPVEVEKQ